MSKETEDSLLELTRRIVRSLVDQPELVEVFADRGDDGEYRILVQTGPGELGQVIGRQGHNLEALQAVVQACAGKYHRQVAVELLEPEGHFLDTRPAELPGGRW